MATKTKKEETEREAGRTSGRIGEVLLVAEIIEVDSGEVGVVFVVRIEEAGVVAISEVAEEASVVGEGASGIVMVGIISEEVEEEEEVVPGGGAVEEEIGEDLEGVLVKVAEEVSEVVIMLEDSRRGTHLVAVRTRKLSLTIEFEGKLTEILS